MDYKNTPEGRAVQSKYADLLSLSRPAPIKSLPQCQVKNKKKTSTIKEKFLSQHLSFSIILSL